LKTRIFNVAAPLCLLLATVVTASAESITYSFEAEVPTNTGPMPGSFVLTVPNFVTGTPLTEFTGSDFDSCSAPGTGACIAEFSVGPSPISGQANDIGFGNDVCCFIYFFPDMSFTTPGTYMADAFHSAGTATLTVSVNAVPEPSTLSLAMISLALAVFGLRKRLGLKTGLRAHPERSISCNEDQMHLSTQTPF
jgi:PEP-CTERM motif